MAKQTKILLVEDEEIVQRTIKSILRGLKYRIEDAETGEDALKMLARRDYDAIILDIKLPGINGIEVLRKAHKIRQDLPPVVVLTDLEEVEYAFGAGKEAGPLAAFAFVPKSKLSPASFKETMIAAVNRNQELSRVKVKRCFKHNPDGCNVAIKVPRRLAFVGIPFGMKTVYTKGIQEVVESFNKMTCWRSDELRRTGDFTCKLCGMIQESKIAIFDISTHNPNVMMELGFAFALAKDVIVLKNKKASLPVNLGAFECIEYANVVELSKGLRQFLRAYFYDR